MRTRRISESSSSQVSWAAFYGEYFYRRLEGLPLAECCWLLSTADAEHIYHRTQANRLELELEARELLIGEGECSGVSTRRFTLETASG
jgi:hypothetical protein